ncbi:TetR/AcrR family transcriptional regulator [Streptomyces sp. ISL-66]|uniref:TetR/AcrR family transcriptional regulator n=1 Tax=Streptomyces sp. ISL-66 TaxID=2819186 RepID=UPI001BE9A15D|nr:TetR/AcrR family transcriptional regulator [Streptomyces sp. ISL-66]MBT2470838.1 TetR/AcrR family transcriptional regulator [Streptomyces sp. ISL-66]
MDQDRGLRERLIDVGVQLVTTEGTAALGLREIARRAGVSHGAPRRYFPTHHALLSAIARRGFEDLGSRFPAAMSAGARASVTGSGTDPESSAGPGTGEAREQLRALGRAYVGYALENRGMFELMFRHDLLDSTGQDGPPGAPLRDSTLPLFGLLVSLVDRCGTPGAPRITAAALWANLHGVAQLWAWGSLPLVLGGDPEASVDHVVDAALGAHLRP